MSAALVLSAKKEVRALLPVWTACAAAIAAAPLLQWRMLEIVPIVAYGLGSLALGAHAVGLEYSFQTLPMLLAQPASRARLFAVKFGVLGVLLALLGGAAWLFLLDGARWASPLLVLSLVAACAFTLAPLLTVLSRNTLAGVVFTAGTVGLLSLVAEMAGSVRFGDDRAAVNAFRQAAFPPAVFGICAVAGLLLLRSITRLEAVDRLPGPDVALPAWRRQSRAAVAAGQRTHPIVQLALKEVHLQQMSLIVAALYVTGILAIAIIRLFEPDLSLEAVLPLTVLYGLTLPTLIGAIASAEERHLGTLDGQLLVPIAVRTQWAVKVGVALALALVLAVLVPWTATGALGVVDRLPESSWIVLPVITVLTAVSLYVSSFSSSGVRALVIALPVIYGSVLFLQWLGPAIEGLLRSQIGMDPSRPRIHPGWLVPGVPVLITAAALVAAALRNHRSGERSGWRIARQSLALIALTAMLVTGIVIITL